MEELAIDVAGEQIGRGDRHDRGRYEGSNADRREGDAGEPRREIVQEHENSGAAFSN